MPMTSSFNVCLECKKLLISYVLPLPSVGHIDENVDFFVVIKFRRNSSRSRSDVGTRELFSVRQP